MLRPALILLTFCLFALTARAGEIAVILSDNDGPYQEFSLGLQQALEGSNWRIAHTGTSLPAEPARQFDLIITAGSEALRKSLESSPRTPLLATLLTEYAYREIISASRTAAGVSAIFLDQPAARQALLLQTLFPEKQRIGLLIGPQTRQNAAQLQMALINRNLRPITEFVTVESEILSTLDALMQRCDVLLALPDAQIYSRNTIRPILITSYRYRRPIVAFSPAMVKAGALAALYSTPQQIGKQAAALIIERGTRLPAPATPREFSIDINQSVAEAFGLRLPEETDVFHKLLAGEGTP